MAKIITHKELAKIVSTALLNPSVIEDSDSFEHFLKDLSTVLTDHLGGQLGRIMVDEDDEWTIAIHADESLPSDGGAWKHYDTDVEFKDGVEVEKNTRYNAITNLRLRR